MIHRRVAWIQACFWLWGPQSRIWSQDDVVAVQRLGLREQRSLLGDHSDLAGTWAGQLEATRWPIARAVFPCVAFSLSSLGISATVFSIFWEKGFSQGRPVERLCLWRPEAGCSVSQCSAPPWERDVSEHRGESFNCVVNLTGSCYSSPNLGCISMALDLCGVFVYAVHCMTGSVGSSGKNGGTRLQRSSEWFPALVLLCCKALNVLLHVPDPHLPCKEG